MAHRTVPAADDNRGPAEMALMWAFEAGQAFRSGEPHTACPYDAAGGDEWEKFRSFQWLLGNAGAAREAGMDPVTACK